MKRVFVKPVSGKFLLLFLFICLFYFLFSLKHIALSGTQLRKDCMQNDVVDLTDSISVSVIEF